VGRHPMKGEWGSRSISQRRWPWHAHHCSRTQLRAGPTTSTASRAVDSSAPHGCQHWRRYVRYPLHAVSLLAFLPLSCALTNRSSRFPRYTRRPRGTHARCILRPDSGARSSPMHLVLGLAHCLLDLCPHVLMARLPLTMGFRHRNPQHDELSRRMDLHRNGLFPCGRHSGSTLLALPDRLPRASSTHPSSLGSGKGLPRQCIAACRTAAASSLRSAVTGPAISGRARTDGKRPVVVIPWQATRRADPAGTLQPTTYCSPEANVVPWTAAPFACEAGRAGVRHWLTEGSLVLYQSESRMRAYCSELIILRISLLSSPVP
jgi:hypothetical protein